MNIFKKDLLKRQIMSLLLKNPQNSIKDISRKINLSKKTVGIYLKELSDELIILNMGEILKKRGCGVFLIANDYQKDLILKFFDLEKLNYMSLIKNNGLSSLLEILLDLPIGKFITKKELAKIIYESLPTLSMYLKKASDWLNKYEIQIEILRKKGVRIIGLEISRRFALRDLIQQYGESHVIETLKLFCPSVDIVSIRNILKKCEENLEFKLTPTSFTNLWILICISLSRSKYSIGNDCDSLCQKGFNGEIKIAALIFENIRRFERCNHGSELIYIITLQLIVSEKIKWFHSPYIKNNVNLKNNYNNKVSKFVSIFLNNISKFLEIDLSNDKWLYNSLYKNFRVSIFRLKLKYSENYPLSLNLKEKYKNVYLSVLASDPLFESFFRVQLDNEEIDKIISYIIVSLLKIRKNKEGIFITNLGRNQRILTLGVIENYLPELTKISVVSTSTFKEEKIDLSNKLIFTNEIGINLKRSIKINDLPNDNDLLNLRKHLNYLNIRNNSLKASRIDDGIFSKEIKFMFNKKCMDLNSNYHNKEDVLKKAVAKLEKLNFVRKGFFDSLWNREKMADTYIGNSISVPHGDPELVNTSCVYIITLRNHIQWANDENTNIIFLLAPGADNFYGFEYLKVFFHDIVSFSENKKKVNVFLKMSSQQKMFKYLINS